jgi:hypothetical protein
MQLSKKQPLIAIKAVQYRVTPRMAGPGHTGEQPFCKPDPLPELEIIQPIEAQMDLTPLPLNDCGDSVDQIAVIVEEQILNSSI